MDMKVTGNNKENLQKMGFAEEDQNYQVGSGCSSYAESSC